MFYKCSPICRALARHVLLNLLTNTLSHRPSPPTAPSHLRSGVTGCLPWMRVLAVIMAMTTWLTCAIPLPSPNCRLHEDREWVSFFCSAFHSQHLIGTQEIVMNKWVVEWINEQALWTSTCFLTIQRSAGWRQREGWKLKREGLFGSSGPLKWPLFINECVLWLFPFLLTTPDLHPFVL